MIRLTTRMFVVLVLSLGLLGILAAPAGATPGGNSANAAMCENGGYLNYTDDEGNGFRNAGQCTRYAARGSSLIPVTTPAPNVTLTWYAVPVYIHACAATVTVTGFTHLEDGDYRVSGLAARLIITVSDGAGSVSSHDVETGLGPTYFAGQEWTATVEGVSSAPSVAACGG